MTNILSLPQLIGSKTQFVVAQNADWVDSIAFSAIGSPIAATLLGTITASSATVTGLSSTTALAPGMPISQAYGIPAGTFIGTIASSTSITMVNSAGTAALATATNPSETLYFQPIPLDITGIYFRMQLRKTVAASQSWLEVSTANGMLVNGGTTGTLGWVVNGAILNLLPVFTYYADLIAQADGRTVNLFQSGPCTVQVIAGATR